MNTHKKVTNAQISAVMAELGRRGNLGRPKRMTRAEHRQRREAARRSADLRRGSPPARRRASAIKQTTPGVVDNRNALSEAAA